MIYFILKLRDDLISGPLQLNIEENDRSEVLGAPAADKCEDEPLVNLNHLLFFIFIFFTSGPEIIS